MIRNQDDEPGERRRDARTREAARMAEAERWAWRRVRSLRAFYTHLTAYVVLNFILLLIDTSTPGPAWFYAPLTGWGLILGFHALYVHEMLPWTTKDWQGRKLRELIESQTPR